MVLAEKEIPEEVYQAWNNEYKEALTAIKGRALLMDKLAEEIEKDLMLVGGTAIEDKLQEKADDTILFIKKAGIKFWVLTGDKKETAVNIAFSCKLLNTKSIQMAMW